MKLLILPGFSQKNKQWGQEAAEYLQNDFEVIIHEWKHWETGKSSDFSEEFELESIVNKVGNQEINVLAKSVGTHISMLLLDKGLKINKLILCGLPSENKLYKKLVNFPSKEVIAFQNVQDPFATHKEVDEFLGKINKDVKVISKPRTDHHYPFYEDFRKFLTSGE